MSSFKLDFKMFDKTFFPLVENKIPDSAKKGLGAAAFELLRDADVEAPQTPTDIKNLKGSRTITKPKIQMGAISIEAGYTSEYAAYQHEGERKDGSHKVLNYTTDKGASQPGPKFLQSKMVRHKEKYIGIAADVIGKTKV